MQGVRNHFQPSLKMVRKSRSSFSRPPKGRGNCNEIGYYVEPNARGKSNEPAKRPYGQIHLKVDPSLYLSPQNSLENNFDEQANSNLIYNLNKLGESKKGCLVWFILEYFETSDNVTLLVETLLVHCLRNEYIMDVTTNNFLLISNIVTYGEKIKVEMFNALKHINDDITKFGFGDRFRKHLDSYRRYKSLAVMALAAIKYFMYDNSFDSLVLLTSLVQLNLHSLCKWFSDDVSIIVDTFINLWEEYKDREEQKWLWISGILDIVYEGGILPKSLYNRYAKRLGTRWTDNVIYPPVQVSELPSDELILGNFDRFYIDYDDIIRNMYVNLP